MSSLSSMRVLGRMSVLFLTFSLFAFAGRTSAAPTLSSTAPAYGVSSTSTTLTGASFTSTKGEDICISLLDKPYGSGV